MKRLVLIAMLLVMLFPLPASASRPCSWRYAGRVTYQGASYYKYQSTCYRNVVKLVPAARYR